MVTTRRYTLDERRAVFETFVDLAHATGARKVQNGDVTLSDDLEAVILYFSHSNFPDARFGYRAKAPNEDSWEEVWLGEELATGALHRTVRDSAPMPDDRGITWLYLQGQLLRADS